MICFLSTQAPTASARITTIENRVILTRASMGRNLLESQRSPDPCPTCRPGARGSLHVTTCRRCRGSLEMLPAAPPRSVRHISDNVPRSAQGGGIPTSRVRRSPEIAVPVRRTPGPAGPGGASGTRQVGGPPIPPDRPIAPRRPLGVRPAVGSAPPAGGSPLRPAAVMAAPASRAGSP